MDIIKIDKNIPVPKSKKYPWDKMEVGDSIYIDSRAMGKSAATCFNIYIKRNKLDWKYKSRTEGNGTRIWRVK